MTRPRGLSASHMFDIVYAPIRPEHRSAQNEHLDGGIKGDVIDSWLENAEVIGGPETTAAISIYLQLVGYREAYISRGGEGAPTIHRVVPVPAFQKLIAHRLAVGGIV